MYRRFFGEKLTLLFLEKSKHFTHLIETLSTIPAKKARLVVQIPVMSTDKTFVNLICAIMELIFDVTRKS